MSTNNIKFKLQHAKQIAEKYKALLEPHCEKIEIAGSIRREKQYIGDIEIVCIPKRTSQVDIFDLKPAKAIPSDNFIKTIKKLKVIKGKPDGRYLKIALDEGLSLDLFTTFKDNWGYILAIRTGSDKYSHLILAKGWVKAGYKGIDGFLWKVWGPAPHEKEMVPVRTEKELFRLIGKKYEEPKYREVVEPKRF